VVAGCVALRCLVGRAEKEAFHKRLWVQVQLDRSLHVGVRLARYDIHASISGATITVHGIIKRRLSTIYGIQT
jgi:hypothetical protein